MARLRPSALVTQLCAIIGGSALFAAPPAHGAMLLVPTSAAATRAMLPAATRAGARLVGPGPFAGSYVVSGARAALLPALIGRGVLLFAAPPSGCGA